jgi:epoxyqueuosine reductase
MPEDVKSFLRKRAIQFGFHSCGFAAASNPATGPFFIRWLESGRHGAMAWLERTRDKRLNPALVLPGVKTIIMLAASYATDNRPLQGPRGLTGKIARYARNNDYHEILGSALSALTQELKQTVPQEIRWFVDSGPVLERDWAQQAGLGFIGKHTNLICRGEGNWVFLASIFTTLAIEPDKPERNRCGSCVRCIQACPTRAITAPFELDARRCISYLTIELKGSIPVELRSAIGDRVFGCDDCLAACPWNRFARENRFIKEYARPDMTEPDLLDWISLDKVGFEARFRGTPLQRLKWPRFRRNIGVVLGNIGDATALPALERVANDVEPMAAEHAEWAMDRIRARLAHPPPPGQVGPKSG